MGRIYAIVIFLLCGIPCKVFAGIVQVAANGNITFNMAELPVASSEITIPPDVVKLAGWTSNADGSVSMAVNTAEEVSANLAQPLSESVTASIEATAEEIGSAGAEWCFAAPEVCLAGVGVAGLVGAFLNPQVTYESCNGVQQWCKTISGTQTLQGRCYSTGYNVIPTDLGSCESAVVGLYNGRTPGFSLAGVQDLSGNQCVATDTQCSIIVTNANHTIYDTAGIFCPACAVQANNSTLIPATPDDWREAYFNEMQAQSQPSAQATVLPQALSAAAQPIQVAQTAPATLTATPAQQTVDLGSSATTNADGTTSTQQQTATLFMNCSGSTVTNSVCAPSTTEQTSTTTPQGTVTTTQTQGQEQQATQQCGLAGQAACVVVEPSTYAAPSLATPSTFAQSTTMFMSRVQAAPLLAGITSLALPTGGSCPTFTLNAWFVNGTIDAQCGIFESIRPELTGICFAVFCLVAIRVFMSA